MHPSILREEFSFIVDLEQKPLKQLFQMIVDRYFVYGNTTQLSLLYKAFEIGEEVHKKQKRESGAPYFSHPLIATLLMMEYEPNIPLIIAMLLHDSVEDSTDPEKTSQQIIRIFGEDIFYLIDGVSKVFASKIKEGSASETLEKLFALAEKDVRILIIKLFDRLHNTITILGKKDIKKREKKLKETLRIYVPLSERLGLWSIKKKLEDAALLGISEEEYIDVMSFQESSLGIQKKIEQFMKENAFHSSVRIEIKKYSVSSLLKTKKENPYMEPQDTFFVRCIVPEKEDCYLFLAQLSEKLPQKKSLFADFILRKKENEYQAIHSVHIFDNQYAITFHITAQSMQQKNDKGIFLAIAEEKYSLSLLQGSDIHKYIRASEDFISFLSTEILLEKITIHGKDFQQKSLPKEARVIDILIAAYPEKFEYASLARKNSHPVDLFDHLEDHDIVQFEFAEVATISQQWKTYTTLVSTQKWIDEYFSRQEKSIKIEQGKAIIQPLMDELHQGDAEDLLERYPILKKKLGYQNSNELFIALYEGNIHPSDILALVNTQKSDSWRKWFSFLSKDAIISRIQFFCHKSRFSAECSQKLFTLAEENNVDVLHFSVDQNAKKHFVSGEAIFKAKKDYEMLHLLEMLSSLSHFSFHVIPSWQFWIKMGIGFLFPTVTLIAIFSFLFSPYASHFSEFLYLSVFIILFVNVFSYSFLAKYFSILRYKSFFWGLLALFNLFTSGAFLYFFFAKGFDIFHVNFFLPLIVLLFSIALPVFLHLKKEMPQNSSPSFSSEEWIEKQKQKKWGYFFRLLAVIIWGIEPILIKYTPFATITHVEVKTFFHSLGAVLTLSISLFIIEFFRNRNRKRKDSIAEIEPLDFKLTMNKYFLFILLGSFSWFYFAVLSLTYTAGTNFILLANFAPIFALLVGLIFWRKDLPYFQKKSHILFIFITFILGSIGSSFLFYNDFLRNDMGSILGNIFAFITMLSDVLLVVSQIKYSKYLKANQSFLVNIYIYTARAIIAFLFSWYLLSSASFESIVWALFIGGVVGIAMTLNFETFKRMDGFIAFLMFNIAIFLTFSIETFILGTLVPTWLILIGGLLIIGASISAEYINTLSEKKQIQD